MGELLRGALAPLCRFWVENRTASCLRGSKSCRWESVAPLDVCADCWALGGIARGEWEEEAASDMASGSAEMTGRRMGSVLGL